MNRLDRLQDALGSADDALGLIRWHLARGRVPATDAVELCLELLRCSASTMEGALTLPVEEGTEAQRHGGTKAQRHRGTEALRHGGDPPDPPGEDLWFRTGSMA